MTQVQYPQGYVDCLNKVANMNIGGRHKVLAQVITKFFGTYQLLWRITDEQAYRDMVVAATECGFIKQYSQGEFDTLWKSIKARMDKKKNQQIQNCPSQRTSQQIILDSEWDELRPWEQDMILSWQPKMDLQFWLSTQLYNGETIGYWIAAYNRAAFCPTDIPKRLTINACIEMWVQEQRQKKSRGEERGGEEEMRMTYEESLQVYDPAQDATPIERLLIPVWPDDLPPLNLTVEDGRLTVFGNLTTQEQRLLEEG